MIEISIVTGTYNRLQYLQKMYNSAKMSIGVGLPYEFVIVDGGSTDGTIKWCKAQKDIVLIEQKKLMGAVKAFNEGAYKASGRYVILANDDIEFVGNSILSVLSFMHDNPFVGIGCFAQDRGNQSWHVGSMSAIVNGKHGMAYYGQVCMVQKWLGDKVGWWGDYLYTYGGDNELSCNMLELGYKVLPVPCAYIHDNVLPEDELRRKNNQDLMINGKHPDTEAWLKKWTRKGKLGPIVRNYPVNPIVLISKQRFFYMPIYEPGHSIQKISKHGLKDALAKVGLVVECDYLSMKPADILDLSCAFDAPIILTQFQNCDNKDLFIALKDQQPNAKYVNWNGDFHPDSLLSDDYALFMKEFDYVGVVTTLVKDVFDRHGVNWFYWQIGYEETLDKFDYKVRKHDVCFQANGYSKERIALATNLRAMDSVNVGLYGSWPTNIKANGNTLYDFNTGAALYRNCKIAIGDSQWPSATGFVSNRLFQTMSAGAFLLHQYFDGMEELLGLRNGEHLVTWLSWEDLEEKIKYYLSHNDERDRIRKAGQEYILKNHSFDKRVEELIRRINA